jgi:hypothetical protein
MLTEVKSLDTELSIKIGDYVSDNGDGELFTQATRLKYIERAYNKTTRLLNLAMDKYAPEFAKRVYTLEFKNVKNGEIIFSSGYSTIEQVVVAYKIPDTQKGTVSVAMKSENTTYLTTAYGINAQKRPDIKNGLIYYSIVNNKILLLPVYDYDTCNILYRKDGEKIEDINAKIPFETNYIDLLLSFAAAEAMVDLGRGDKANAFYDDAYSQIKLLQTIAMTKKREAGNS